MPVYSDQLNRRPQILGSHETLGDRQGLQFDFGEIIPFNNVHMLWLMLVSIEEKRKSILNKQCRHACHP